MLFEEVKNINENFINPAPIVRQNEASVSIENICSKFEDFLRNKGIYIAQDGWDESKIPGKLLSTSNGTNILKIKQATIVNTNTLVTLLTSSSVRILATLSPPLEKKNFYKLKKFAYYYSRFLRFFQG